MSWGPRSSQLSAPNEASSRIGGKLPTSLTAGGTIVQYRYSAAGHRYYRKYHLGSVRAVVTGNGTVQETRDYYLFGLMMPGRETTEASGAKEDYTSHELDAETDLHYAGARYYMSALGRWTSTDPILGKQSPGQLLREGKLQAFSMSAYNYSFNNPINLKDATGEWPTPDTFLDLGFIAYDIYDIGRSLVRGEGVSGTQVAAWGRISARLSSPSRREAARPCGRWQRRRPHAGGPQW